MLSLHTASFWSSLYLLVPSQISLRSMAAAQAAEPCSVLLTAVRAVESQPDEGRKHSACCEEATLPSSLPAPFSAPCTSFWVPSDVYGRVLHIWALADHFLFPSLGSSGSLFLLEVPCLVLLLIHIQALYFPFIPGSPNTLYISTSLQGGQIRQGGHSVGSSMSVSCRSAFSDLWILIISG